MAVIDQDYVSVAKAAELMKVSRSTIWRWIDEGTLPAYRLGRRRVLIRQQDLATLITPARGKQMEDIGKIAEERERLGHPMTEQERRKALAALAAARHLKDEMVALRGEKLFSDSAEIVREMREERTRELL